MTFITNGAGTGHKAEVTKLNQLSVLGTTVGLDAFYSFRGETYNINTGTINLSSANKSALLYMKNNEEFDIVIGAFFYLLGTSDGTGDTLVQIEKNPTAGTLVSAGTAFLPSNRNFGSKKLLDITLLSGIEGRTLSGRDDIAIESIFSGVGRKTVSVGAIILPTNSSVGITITPPAGNGDMDVQLAMALYRNTSDLFEP